MSILQPKKTNLFEKLAKSELKLIQKLGLQNDLELILKEFEQQKKELELLELLELSKSHSKKVKLETEGLKIGAKTEPNQKINGKYKPQKKFENNFKNLENLEKWQNLKLENQNKIRSFFLNKVLETSKKPQVYTFPTIINQNSTSQTEHEATTSQISQEILVYLQARGLTLEVAKMLIVGGFCGDILGRLPMEFALEARKLVELTLENGFG